MKKKIFSVALVAIVAVAAAWSFNKSSNKVTLSDVALSNVEVLAYGEGGSGRLCSKSGMGCIIRYSDGSSTYISGRWN